VTWDATSYASEYCVFRATSETGPKTTLSGWQSATIFDDYSADVGTTYTYWVRARNVFGESDFSAPDTGWRNPVPSPPVGVTASNGTFIDRVRVTWPPAPAATEYCVYRAVSAPESATTKIVSQSSPPSSPPTDISGWQPATIFDDFTAVPGVTYDYWVKARNAFGESDFSVSVSGWRRAEPSTRVRPAWRRYR
jgi:cellulose 1,4-beta-cellobiosidase